MDYGRLQQPNGRKYLGNNIKKFQGKRADLFRINSEDYLEEKFMKIETNI